MRSCNVKKIYVLLRDKKNVPIADRLEKIKQEMVRNTFVTFAATFNIHFKWNGKWSSYLLKTVFQIKYRWSVIQRAIASYEHVFKWCKHAVLVDTIVGSAKLDIYCDKNEIFYTRKEHWNPGNIAGFHSHTYIIGLYNPSVRITA